MLLICLEKFLGIHKDMSIVLLAIQALVEKSLYLVIVTMHSAKQTELEHLAKQGRKYPFTHVLSHLSCISPVEISFKEKNDVVMKQEESLSVHVAQHMLGKKKQSRRKKRPMDNTDLKFTN